MFDCVRFAIQSTFVVVEASLSPGVCRWPDFHTMGPQTSCRLCSRVLFREAPSAGFRFALLVVCVVVWPSVLLWVWIAVVGC